MAERLTELIELLEKLDGPAREVDALIWCVEAPEMVNILPHWTEEQQEEIVPRFTGSLDEAVALVERMLPGWAHAHIREELRGCIGYVHNNQSAFVGVAATRNPKRKWFEARAATPAIALLIALLRASSEGGNKP